MRPALLMQNVARLAPKRGARGVTWIPPVDPHAGVKVGDKERYVLCGPSCGRGLRVIIRSCVLCAAQIINMRREVNTVAVNTVAAIAIDCETPHSAAEVTELKGVTQPPRLLPPMALFDVPGWSVPHDPVAATPRKRKRTSKHGSNKKIQSATVNVEKVMEQLSARLGPAAESPLRDLTEGKNGGPSTEDDRPPRTKRRRAQGNKSQQSPIPATQQVEPHKPSKKRKKERPKQSPPAGDKVPGSRSTASQLPTETRSALTSLQHDMKHSLDGARFRCVTPAPNFYAADSYPCTLKPHRWINEKLYKSDSANAHAMMREDPAVFDDVRSPHLFLPVLTHANPQYHKGFRRQVESWPSNPVSHYISTLSSYPPRTVIADLGCGDAALARVLIPKGHTVMSFDLVADHAFVIEADIFDRLPLPGSEVGSDGDGESDQGDAQIVNVVVCALSLMGTNWPKCIRESWRILRPKYVSGFIPE